MTTGERAFAAALALLAAAGCGSVPLDPLPAAPPERNDAAASPQDGEPEPEEPFVPPADPLVPSADGDRVLPGLVLTAPSLEPGTAIAVFGLRNEGRRDLPDLILAVIFAVRAGGDDAPLVPRMETVEAPLRRGESREFRVQASSVQPGERVDGFRVAPGLPGVLTERAADDRPGTTFLGGLLECDALDVDLTSDPPRVVVDLVARGEDAGAAPLARLECQLLLGRAGRLVWSGPWILVPAPDAENRGRRRIRWTIHDAPGVAGCVPFLRVRERR